MSLSKDQILSAADLETRVVSVPEWGGEVTLRSMTGTDRDAYEQSITRIQGDKAVQNFANAKAKFLAKCIVDDDGELMFTSASDIVALGGKSNAAIERLFLAAADMNGLSDESIEAIEGNSDAAQSGASISD